MDKIVESNFFLVKSRNCQNENQNCQLFFSVYDSIINHGLQNKNERYSVLLIRLDQIRILIRIQTLEP
jgi:hypothetical protein